jgi:hypothetical protein
MINDLLAGIVDPREPIFLKATMNLHHYSFPSQFINFKELFPVVTNENAEGAVVAMLTLPILLHFLQTVVEYYRTAIWAEICQLGFALVPLFIWCTSDIGVKHSV